MPMYVKKPIPVEAIEYNIGLEDGFDDIEVAIENGFKKEYYEDIMNLEKVPFILTLEGKHYVRKGDYIITGISGERYPCKKNIFIKTYELVNK